jgi:hypothetical protein
LASKQLGVTKVSYTRTSGSNVRITPRENEKERINGLALPYAREVEMCILEGEKWDQLCVYCIFIYGVHFEMARNRRHSFLLLFLVGIDGLRRKRFVAILGILRRLWSPASEKCQWVFRTRQTP